MMKSVLTITAIIAAFGLFAQQKGASPVPGTTAPKSSGTTWAVVVGISDYQDKEIPDLKFAHRDAEAFASFLRSPGGGTLDGDHLKVLINRDATTAQLVSSLDWLMENSREGDQAIIYFSGHGDVENKLRNNVGFLLTWDSPARAYMAGAYPIFYLQNVIETISLDKKAKVVLITDACRSGKLAGNDIGGSSLTNANLAKQFANEIKILSCQPNEFSIEGEQWGGGRGAFSFNLVDALYGMADQNKDLFVTLQEVGRYLEDHVTAEVAPVSQVPMVIGNRTERLASVDSKLLADLRSGRNSQMKMLSPVEMRGMEGDVLASVDTTTRELYWLFKKALNDKVFLEPAGACADAYYERLMAEAVMARLHSTMTRNYAAALQDDAQQVMNKWLKTDLSEIAYSPKTATDKYQCYPQYLQRAAELLGPKHYNYLVLQARRHFFQGYLTALSNRNPDKKAGLVALEEFRRAIILQSDMPQAFWQMSLVFGYNMLQPDSAEYYARLAMKSFPTWLLLRTDMAFLFADKFEQYDLSKTLLEEAMDIDSNSILVWNGWGVFYRLQHQYADAALAYRRAIQLDPYFAIAYNNLGLVLCDLRQYDEAEQYFKKAIQLDPDVALPYNNLGIVCWKLRRYDEAEQLCKKAIQMDSNYADVYNTLGIIYNETNRNDESEKNYLKSIQLDSTNKFSYNNLGKAYLNTARYTEAIQYCKKAMQLDPKFVLPYNNLGIVYWKLRQYDEAEQLCKKAIQLDSNYANVYNTLGIIYNETNRNAESEKNYLKSIQLDSAYALTYSNLGNVYIAERRLPEAEIQFNKCIRLDSTIVNAHYNLACLQSMKNQKDAALGFLEKALKYGFDNYDWMQQDTDLAPLRALPEWKSLMKKYFPDKAKD